LALNGGIADRRRPQEILVEQRVLVVEDEAAIRDMVAFALKRAGLQPMLAEDARSAQHLIAERLPDQILLDWMLPGASGLEFARRLRREELTREIPVIMLTARGEEDDRVLGLDAGVDDYIVKPFSTRELIARIRAVLRRTQPHGDGQTISLGGLTLDTLSHRVFAHEKPVQLGPTEYRLLAFFMTHPERVYTRSQLLDNVWGSGVYVEERTVDVHIRRLRKGLEPCALEDYIQTVRGAGYRFSTTV
jgi:two-component system phosphate regulon response regulator PhoB